MLAGLLSLVPGLTSAVGTAATIGLSTALNGKSEMNAAQSMAEAEALEEQGRANALHRMRTKLDDQQMQGSNAAEDRMGQII